MPTFETIRPAPKALLHHHRDGGLRPSTGVDLASEFGYDELPTTDVDDLAAFVDRAVHVTPITGDFDVGIVDEPPCVGTVRPRRSAVA